MNWDRMEAESLAVVRETAGALRPGIEAAAADMVACLRQGGRILICGNGGSAADAQHMAAELVNRFLLDRRPYAAIALTTDTSILTSIGNDFGFDEVFSKQVRALGVRGDVFVAFSTSGTSKNICLALTVAREMGLRTIALTGGAGGRMADLSDRCLCVASTSHTPRIQEGHQMILHILCECIEEQLR